MLHEMARWTDGKFIPRLRVSGFCHFGVKPFFYFLTHRSYNILILLVTYIIPILLIGICSFHMSIVLWCKQPVGVITPQLRRVKKKKKKVLK